MALDGKILRLALDRCEAEDRRRGEELRRRRREVYAADPRIGELDDLLRVSVAEAAAAAVSGGNDPVSAVAAIGEKNLALQAERKRRITALGHPADYIDDKPACPDCGDRRYVGARPCHCLMAAYREEQRRELSRLLDLQGERFENFDLSYYDDPPVPAPGISARKNMEMVLRICRSYAERFDGTGGSLFLTGAPGLGKTFLSACIASVVSEKGYSVVYDTVRDVIANFEEARFGRRGEQEEAESEVRRILRCDLLILDDLGTEMSTSFSVSVIYDILNTRLREGRSTVVSSNLDPEELARRYSPQIASRLTGSFEYLRFYGQDIRLQKKSGKKP